MGRRSDHTRDELRELMLSAARTIIIHEGLEGLTVRKIAGKIGYTVGTLYNIFANLDDLILHLNSHTLDEMHHALAQAIAPCEGPEESLCALASFYIKYSEDHIALWRLVFEHHIRDSRYLPQWYKEKVAVVLHAIEEILKDLMVGKDPEEITRMSRILWAGIHGICVLTLSERLEDVESEPAGVLAEALIRRCIGIECAIAA